MNIYRLTNTSNFPTKKDYQETASHEVDEVLIADQEYQVSTMSISELDATRREWAKAEGWPSVKHGMDAVYSIDPLGFYKLSRDNEKVATISAVCYPELNFSYIGFFIVPEPLRGQHFGAGLLRSVLSYSQVWRNIDNYALSCFADMCPLYEKFGFATESQDYIWQYTSKQSSNSDGLKTMAVTAEVLDNVIAYDKQIFPAQRSAYLQHYICKANSTTIIALNDQQQLIGYGVISEREPANPEPLRSHRIGPLYAEDKTVASAILNGLVKQAGSGENIFLETSSHNQSAEVLLENIGFTNIVSLNRMIKGRYPQTIDTAKIYCCASLVTGG